MTVSTAGKKFERKYFNANLAAALFGTLLLDITPPYVSVKKQIWIAHCSLRSHSKLRAAIFVLSVSFFLPWIVDFLPMQFQLVDDNVSFYTFVDYLPIQILLPKYQWNESWSFTMLIFYKQAVSSLE